MILSNNSSFTVVPKPQDKASANPQNPVPKDSTSQQPAIKKKQNIILTSTSLGGLPDEQKNMGARKISSNQAGKVQNQQIKTLGGGKLQTNKANNDQLLGNATLTATQLSKKQDQQSLSPIYKLREELFMYNKIKKNTLERQNAEQILKTFQILTSDLKKRFQILQDLRKQDLRFKLIDMPYLYNSTTNNQNEAKYYFSLVITQLMADNSYLSFQGALYLLNNYLKIHKDLYYSGQKFNLNLILKECNIKILNEMSSGSIKNEAFFQKMVKEIAQLKDIIMLQYRNFLIMLEKYYEDQSLTKNKFIYSDLFLQGLAKSVWSNFKNLINAQKNIIVNIFEIKITLFCLQTILRIKANVFDQKIVMQQILPTIVSNIKLIQASKIKLNFINFVDEFILHLTLIHPFNSKTCVKPAEFLLNNEIDRYGYLLYFSDREIQNLIYPYPIKAAQASVFIEKMIQFDKKFSKYSTQKDNFIFYSIYNILKDNPSRFWSRPESYKNIKQYIWFIESKVQQFSQSGYEIDCYFNYNYEEFYRNVWKFAHLLGLLLFPTINEQLSLQRFLKIVKNRYIIRDFINVAIQMIVVVDPTVKQSNLNQKIDTQPIYQFLHKLIIHNPDFYFDSTSSLAKQYQNDAIELELFGNYFMRFAEYGLSDKVCIVAFTKLIKQSNEKVNAIMNHLAQIDKNIHVVPQSKQQISKLQYIVKSLMQKKQNYVPLATNILWILKKFPTFNTHPWMQRLLNEFKQLPQKMHPENISQYAYIIEACLKFIESNPKYIMTLQQFFRFKFASQYLNHILEISHENGAIFNKHMKGNVYDQVFTAVKLLKAMTSLYLKEKILNQGELVPYEIRKVLQSPNKDGDYQVTMRNSALSYHAISYHIALITVLLSKEFNYDIEMRQYPNFKNEILQTLINLNTICLQTKNEINLKISIIYNKQLEAEINKKINLKLQLLDYIFKNPSYLGYEYLITSGSLQLKQKKLMLERVKQIKEQKQLSNLKNKSHFIVIYWKQIQNAKIQVDFSKGWIFIIKEVTQIMEFLETYQNIQSLSQNEREKVSSIMQNLQILSDLLKNSSKEIYIKFIIKFHNIFFDFRYNGINNISSRHQISSNYQNSLLIFFTAKSFISNEQFALLVKQKQMHTHIFEFIRDLLKLMYKKNYNVLNDVINLEIVQFGLAFLIQLGADQVNTWFKQIKRLLIDRPNKNTPMLTRQIIILVLINSRLGQKIPQQLVQFGNKDWLLLMNEVQPNVRHSSILISQLYTIYDMHYIYFTSTCHYLCEVAKSKYLEQLYQVSNYKTLKNTVNILIDLLKKSIQAEKSYYSIWIVQVLIEIFMNKIINKNVRQKFCRDIRIAILSMSSLHDRIGQLFSKFGSIYSKNYINLWKTSSSNSKNESKILFSQKQQLLAYLRILTFIFFMEKGEKQILQLNQTMKKHCDKVEQDILLSFLQLLPLIGCLLKDQSERQAIVVQCQWQKKLKSFDLTKLPLDAIKSSGIKQLSADKLSEIWKNRTGLNILHEVTNIQLATITTMWISTLKSLPQPQLNKIFFKNAEQLQSYFHKFMKFLQSLKKHLIVLNQGKNQIKSVIQFLSSKIYLGSIQISKQLMYTNMPNLSSSLPLNHDEIKNRLVQSFEFVYTLVRHIYDISSGQKIKSDQKFSKIFNHFLRSCKEIKHYLQQSGSVIEIPDHESNRSEYTYNTKSYTKSRIVWS